MDPICNTLTLDVYFDKHLELTMRFNNLGSNVYDLSHSINILNRDHRKLQEECIQILENKVYDLNHSMDILSKDLSHSIQLDIEDLQKLLDVINRKEHVKDFYIMMIYDSTIKLYFPR